MIHRGASHASEVSIYVQLYPSPTYIYKLTVNLPAICIEQVLAQQYPEKPANIDIAFEIMLVL